MDREAPRVRINRVAIVTKVAKIATMLAVYLLWICGNSAIAISCHADQKEHAHCCKSCECHHDGCDKQHIERPHSCHHDHSNTIVLYDSTKKSNLNIEPIVLSIISNIVNNFHVDNIATKRISQHFERKISIKSSPTLSRRGLRAPPVIA